MTQLGKHYGLPVYINVGLTDAKRPDAQAGLEIGATLMLGASAGADIFGHMGICGVDQGSSLDMLILQHEAIRYVESVMRQVEVSDETLGLGRGKQRSGHRAALSPTSTPQLTFAKNFGSRRYQTTSISIPGTKDGTASMEATLRSTQGETAEPVWLRATAH